MGVSDAATGVGVSLKSLRLHEIEPVALRREAPVQEVLGEAVLRRECGGSANLGEHLFTPRWSHRSLCADRALSARDNVSLRQGPVMLEW